MASSILPELGMIVTGLAIGGGFIGLGWKADGGISPEFRNKLSGQIIRLRRIEPGETWPTIFADLFDHVFGKKHDTFRCFSRSSFASLISVGVVILIWVQVSPEDLSMSPAKLNFRNIFGLSIFFIGVNIITDYISLLETRYVIQWMSQIKSGLKFLALLLFDTLVTALIFLFGLVMMILGAIITSKFFPGLGPNIQFFPIFVDWITHGIARFPGGLGPSPNILIFFYTTFFTSVWVWLFALAWGAMRLVGRIQPGIQFLIWALPVEEYPIRSISMVLGTVACISYWVFGSVVRLF